MKILIVSFDKGLVKKLKNLLPTHEIIEVKNGEEAVKTVRADVDVVVYDAISGALSEEDINNMYKQRFGEARFIVLVDELFPVDMGNILPPNKVRLSREDEIEKVPEVLEGAPMPSEESSGGMIEPQIPMPPEEAGAPVPEQEGIETQIKEEFVIEHTPFESPPTSQEVEIAQEQQLQEFQIPSMDTSGTSEMETMPKPEEIQPTEPIETLNVTGSSTQAPGEKITDTAKVLVVSFDTLLIDNIRNTLGNEFTVEVAKNTKEAIEKRTDAQVIIYDAISGVIAEKGLMEMSQDEDYKRKAYIILIDELFPISVDHIPLDTKIVISREAEIHLMKEKVEEAIASLPKETPSLQESTPQQISPEYGNIPESAPVETPSEEKPLSVDYTEDVNLNIEELSMSAVENIEVDQKETTPISDTPISDIAPPKEEKQIPEVKDVDIKINTDELVNRLLNSIDFESIIKQAIKDSIDEDLISSLLRQEIESAFANVDVKGVIKEVVASILKEKVEELLS